MIIEKTEKISQLHQFLVDEYKKDNLTVSFVLESFSLRIQMGDVFDTINLDVTVTKNTFSKLIANNIPFGTDYNFIEFQIFGHLDLENMYCQEIIVRKDDEIDAYLENDPIEKKNIDNTFQKAAEFILEIISEAKKFNIL